jgi:thiamine-monophosphate kinase
MAMNEFALIKRYFVTPNAQGAGAGRLPHVALGPGDDCALTHSTPQMVQAISADMLVAGRHFFEDTDPQQLGHKALAVNLSDLAAMGATPRSFTLALALPTLDEPWVAAFSKGLLALASAHDCALIGGDITRGPLTIAITVIGEVPPTQALRRNGAQSGDDLYVSGTLGDAALALRWALQDPQTTAVQTSTTVQARQTVESRMTMPTPRVALGQALRGVATAAMDISDGLAGDLHHLLAASQCGAEVAIDTLPVSPTVATLPVDLRRALAFAGGDDYELLFAAPPNQAARLAHLAAQVGVKITRIGRITDGTALVLRDAKGVAIANDYRGFDHFSE